MTTKPKPDPKDEAEPEVAATGAEPAKAPLCGVPHVLPMLAGHVTCQLDAQELEPGEAGHEHQHQDGDALYTWT